MDSNTNQKGTNLMRHEMFPRKRLQYVLTVCVYVCLICNLFSTSEFLPRLKIQRFEFIKVTSCCASFWLVSRQFMKFFCMYCVTMTLFDELVPEQCSSLSWKKHVRQLTVWAGKVKFKLSTTALPVIGNDREKHPPNKTLISSSFFCQT